MTTYLPIDDAASFARRVVLGQTSENRVLEFKEEYRWQRNTPEDRASQAEELCRDVAQFANTDGGVLLVGVTEREEDGRRVADGIKSVDAVDGLRQWAEQAIRKHLTPSTFSRSMNAIVLPAGGTILAINVPPSLHLVALWVPERKRGVEYLYRTGHGKEWFNPDEVERHIMNGSRAMQIRLAHLFGELAPAARGGPIPVELSPPAQIWMVRQQGFGPQPPVRLAPAGASDYEIELMVHNVCVRLPHGLIFEAWRTSDQKLGLYLKVGIVVTDEGAITLNPVATG